MKLFLDLEATFITDIDSMRVMPENIGKLKVFVNEWSEEITYIETFTFAMFSEIDRLHVDQFSDMMSNILGKKVHTQDWWTKELRKEFVSKTLFPMNDKEMMDFVQFANKERCFEFFCLKNHSGEKCFLIDDTVPNKHVFFSDSTTEVNFIDVNNWNDILLPEVPFCCDCCK